MSRIIKMMCLMLMMSVIIILSTSAVLLWWGALLMMSVLFLAYIKHTEDSSLLKYFIVQEFAGMILGLLLLAGYQGMMINMLLMIKLAVAPFHFWLITAIEHMSDMAFAWATTFQKLPGALMLLQLMNPSTMSILILGTLFSVLQLFTVTSAKSIILVSSTSTMGWILFLQAKNWMHSALILTGYLLLMMLILTSSNSKNMETSMSLTVTLLNLPLSFIFIIKATFFMDVSEMSMVFAMVSLWSTYLSLISYFCMLTHIQKIQEDFSFPMAKLFYTFNMLTLFLLIR